MPFSLFVSLSAGENVLPSMGSEYATGGAVRTEEYAVRNGGIDVGKGGGKRSRKGLVRAGVDWLGGWVGETGRMMGIGVKDRGF